MTPKTWTAAEVLALGVRTDVATAGDIFGLSRTQSYEAVKAERFPVPVFRIGHRIVVPVAPIVALLSLDTEAAGSPSPAATTDTRPTTDERPDATHAKRKLRALG